MPTADIVSLALLIQRGQVSLEAVPDAHRPAVQALLRTMTDAQLGVMLAAREAKRKFLGRSRVYQTASS